MADYKAIFGRILDTRNARTPYGGFKAVALDELGKLTVTEKIRFLNWTADWDVDMADTYAVGCIMELRLLLCAAITRDTRTRLGE